MVPVGRGASNHNIQCVVARPTRFANTAVCFVRGAMARLQAQGRRLTKQENQMIAGHLRWIKAESTTKGTLI
jgi:hypothetical protein